jgi:hypothetical protein
MDDDLCVRAASLIGTGVLPKDSRASTFRAISSGIFVCGLCGQSISRGAAQFELVWGHPDASVKGVNLHPVCCSAWRDAVSPPSDSTSCVTADDACAAR